MRLFHVDSCVIPIFLHKVQDSWGAGIAVAKAIAASLAAFAAFLGNKVGALPEPGMLRYVVALASTESMRTQTPIFQTWFRIPNNVWRHCFRMRLMNLGIGSRKLPGPSIHVLFDI